MPGELRVQAIRLLGTYARAVPELRLHAIRILGTYVMAVDATVVPNPMVAGVAALQPVGFGAAGGELRVHAIRILGTYSRGQDATVTPSAGAFTFEAIEITDKNVIPEVLDNVFTFPQASAPGVGVAKTVLPDVSAYTFTGLSPTVGSDTSVTVGLIPGIFAVTPLTPLLAVSGTTNALVDFEDLALEYTIRADFQFPQTLAGDIRVYVHRGKRVGPNRPAFDYPVTGAEARFARLLQDGIEQWQSVYRLTDGTYTDTQPDDYSRIDRVFYGGRDNVITSAERAALTAAGFSEGLIASEQVA